MRFSLNTAKNTRQTLGRVLRAYNRDEIEADKFRNLVYGFSKYLEYIKHEDDLRIEERLEAIEELYEKERKR